MTNPTWPIGPKENELVERVARAIDPVAFDTESRAGQKGYRYRAQRRRDAESNARAVIEALRPELEDAGRYRWLRDGDNTEHCERWMQWDLRTWDKSIGQWTSDLRRNGLDKAIDAARGGA